MELEVVDVTEPEVPEELRDPFRVGPYNVTLSTLVAGAYVDVTEQVQLQRVSDPDTGLVAGPVLGGGSGDDGD